MSISQREAVVTATKSFYGTSFKQMPLSDRNPEDVKKIIGMVIEMFQGGMFSVKNEQKDVNNYIVGMVKNHLKKDPELTGADRPKIINPGSRSFGTDDVIKSLSAALQLHPELKGDIELALEARREELKAEKIKNTVQIDYSLLPESIRSKIAG